MFIRRKFLGGFLILLGTFLILKYYPYMYLICFFVGMPLLWWIGGLGCQCEGDGYYARAVQSAKDWGLISYIFYYFGLYLVYYSFIKIEILGVEVKIFGASALLIAFICFCFAINSLKKHLKVFISNYRL